MKIIIGLGNPGNEYKDTRHNVGYVVVDELKKIKNLKNVMVKKTDVFMNDSGKFVAKFTKLYPLGSNSLYIIHDDLDIKIGEYKIQFGRGPKDHNGILSIEKELGTKDFWRIRVGVDNRPLDGRPMGEEYVLQDFTDDERVVLGRVIKEVASKLKK